MTWKYEIQSNRGKTHTRCGTLDKWGGHVTQGEHPIWGDPNEVPKVGGQRNNLQGNSEMIWWQVKYGDSSEVLTPESESLYIYGPISSVRGIWLSLTSL